MARREPPLPQERKKEPRAFGPDKDIKDNQNHPDTDRRPWKSATGRGAHPESWFKRTSAHPGHSWMPLRGAYGHFHVKTWRPNSAFGLGYQWMPLRGILGQSRVKCGDSTRQLRLMGNCWNTLFSSRNRSPQANKKNKNKQVSDCTSCYFVVYK